MLEKGRWDLTRCLKGQSKALFTGCIDIPIFKYFLDYNVIYIYVS